MQTWEPLIEGEIKTALSIKESPYLSGYVIIPSINDNLISTDFGQTFTSIPMVGSSHRKEIAFGKPNIVTVSGEILLPTNQKIRLTNNDSENDAQIDTIGINITIKSGATISGEVCLRPYGSLNSCSSYSRKIVGNTGGLILFSGSAIDSPDIPKNRGYTEFEVNFDSPYSVISGEISFELDHINYTSSSGSRIENYIHGESFGSGLIYASVDENNGTLYRSKDLGQSWELVSSPHDDGNTLLGNQGWYGNTIWVNPLDFRHIIIGGIDLFESRDGGYNWRKISNWAEQMYGGLISPHADHHSIVSDPRFDTVSNKRVYFGTDGGIYRADNIDDITSTASGWSFAGNGLNITQFYSISGAGNIIQGGAQDNGTSVYQGGVDQKWQSWHGGDGEDTQVDPFGRYIYGEYQNGQGLSRGDIRNGKIDSYGIANFSGGLNESASWTAPMLIDPNNPSRMFFGANSLWMSDNVDSPNALDVVFQNTGNPNPLESIGIIAIARQDSNRIWISKYSSLYNSLSGVTTSGEITDWNQITASNLPSRKITHIKVDYYDPNTIYISFGGYEGSNLWVTHNNGVSWIDISGNLPKAPIYTVKQFRNDSNFLYVGTEVGLFSSEDGGQIWSTTNEGPANTPVFDIEWYNENTLLIATFGRGAWALDLNNLTIVNPPTIYLSGSSIESMSGVQNITYYKDSLDMNIVGNQTIFYTLDGSVPDVSSSGTLNGEIFTLSGNLLIHNNEVLLGENNSVTLKLRSRDFTNNWSDVSTYVYTLKNTTSVINDMSFSGQLILTGSAQTSIIGHTDASESGSIFEVHIEGSTLSGNTVIRDSYSSGLSLDFSGVIDSFGDARIDFVDMSRFYDGIVYYDWIVRDALGKSSYITIERTKDTVETLPILSLSGISQNGVFYQNGILYTKTTTPSVNIITNELSEISVSGTNMSPLTFWNSTILTGSTYKSQLTFSLSGTEGVRSFMIGARDMGDNGNLLPGTTIYDATAPVTYPINYGSGMQQLIGYYKLQGTISDLSPSSLMVNGIPVTQSGNTWSIDVIIQIGGNIFSYTSQDILGNTSTGSWKIDGYQLSVSGPGGGGAGGGGGGGNSLGQINFTPRQSSILFQEQKIFPVIKIERLLVESQMRNKQTTQNESIVNNLQNKLNSVMEGVGSDKKKIVLYNSMILMVKKELKNTHLSEIEKNELQKLQLKLTRLKKSVGKMK